MPTMNVHMISTDAGTSGVGQTIVNAYAGFTTFVSGQRGAHADTDLNVFMAPEFLYGAEARSTSDLTTIRGLAAPMSTGHGNSLVFPGTVVVKTGTFGGGVKNRVPIHYNGTEVLLHTKRNWGGAKKSGGGGGSDAFVGGKKDAYFEIDVGGTKYACGVEICMDHDVGELQTNLAKIGKTVDLHFVTGNTVGAKTSTMCGTKYSIFCNANQNTGGLPSWGCKVFDGTQTEINPDAVTATDAYWTGLVI